MLAKLDIPKSLSYSRMQELQKISQLAEATLDKAIYYEYQQGLE